MNIPRHAFREYDIRGVAERAADRVNVEAVVNREFLVLGRDQ